MRVKEVPYLPAGFYLVEDGAMTVLMRIGHGAVYSRATRNVTETILIDRAKIWTEGREVLGGRKC